MTELIKQSFKVLKKIEQSYFGMSLSTRSCSQTARTMWAFMHRITLPNFVISSLLEANRR